VKGDSERVKQQDFVLLKLQKPRQSARHLVMARSLDTRTFADFNRIFIRECRLLVAIYGRIYNEQM
jgi:hypothetical protein